MRHAREAGVAAPPGVPRVALHGDAGLTPLERTVRLHRLYDLYRGLLTARQQDAFELYHWQDLSLGEVAEHLGISRQAVHDLLRRGEAVLEQAEDALGLGAWRNRASRRLDQLEGLLAAAAQRLAQASADPGATALAEAGALLEQARRMVAALRDDLPAGGV
ncbi:MAG TPA: YlxM family DNA-binding protein [Thermaerobacter sp.]